MKQKDLSEDVELLMWSKYLSESENLSLQYLAACLKANIYEDRDSYYLQQIKVEDIPQSDWINAAPLAHCLLKSSNPILEVAAEWFFKVLHSIALEMTEMMNNWPHRDDIPPFEVLKTERSSIDPLF
jgi:hypothetical protein